MVCEKQDAQRWLDNILELTGLITQTAIHMAKEMKEPWMSTSPPLALDGYGLQNVTMLHYIALKLNQILCSFTVNRKLVAKRYSQSIELLEKRHITCTKTNYSSKTQHVSGTANVKVNSLNNAPQLFAIY